MMLARCPNQAVPSHLPSGVDTPSDGNGNRLLVDNDGFHRVAARYNARSQPSFFSAGLGLTQLKAFVDGSQSANELRDATVSQDR
jgi:hypothetical protein